MKFMTLPVIGDAFDLLKKDMIVNFFKLLIKVNLKIFS
jgi:hypothetical protein